MIYNQRCSQYKSDTDSMDLRISKIWLWDTEILSECRTISAEVWYLWKSLWVFRSAFLHCQFSRSSLLYIEVWKRRCEIASAPKSRCWSLIFHQWSFAWFGCCPMKNQFEIHSLSKGTSMQAKPYSGAVFLSCSADTKQSSGERGCTIRTKYNVNAFVQIANTHLQTPLKWPLQTPLILCLCFRIQ